MSLEAGKNAMEVIPYCDLDHFELIELTKQKIITNSDDYMRELPKLSSAIRHRMWKFYFECKTSYLDVLICTRYTLRDAIRKLFAQKKILYISPIKEDSDSEMETEP